jgi:hypothetical protein
MKNKMAATAGLSLTLDPMGKMFVLRWWPSWISDRHIKQKLCRGPSNDQSWAVWFQLSKWFQRRSVDRKFKMAATAGHRLTLDPMGKCSNAFFSETTNMIKAKLYMNVHWMVLYKFFMYSLALIIFVVSEKKAFEHFPIGFNVNLCPAVATILDFRSA